MWQMSRFISTLSNKHSINNRAPINFKTQLNINISMKIIIEKLWSEPFSFLSLKY